MVMDNKSFQTQSGNMEIIKCSLIMVIRIFYIDQIGSENYSKVDENSSDNNATVYQTGFIKLSK